MTSNIFNDAPSTGTHTRSFASADKQKTTAINENIGQYFDLYMTATLDATSFKNQAEATINAVSINDPKIVDFSIKDDSSFNMRDFINGFVSPYASDATGVTKGIRTSQHMTRYRKATDEQVSNTNITKYKNQTNTNDTNFYVLDTDHKGTDYVGDGSNNLHATQSGFAKTYPNNSPGLTGYGNVVVIRHAHKSGDKYFKLPLVTMYAHLETFESGIDGKFIDKFAKIGVQGDTGGDYASHLHLELRYIPALDAPFLASTNNNSIDYSSINNNFKGIRNSTPSYAVAGDKANEPVYKIKRVSFTPSNVNSLLNTNINSFYNFYTKTDTEKTKFSSLNKSIRDYININKDNYDKYYIKSGLEIQKVVYSIEEQKKDQSAILRSFDFKQFLDQQSDIEDIPADRKNSSALFTFYFPFRINFFSNLYKTVPENNPPVTFSYDYVLGNTNNASMSKNSNFYIKCEILSFPWQYCMKYEGEGQGFTFNVSPGIIDNTTNENFKNMFRVSFVNITEDEKQNITATELPNNQKIFYKNNIYYNNAGTTNGESYFEFIWDVQMNEIPNTNSKNRQTIYNVINIAPNNTLTQNNFANLTKINQNLENVIDGALDSNPLENFGDVNVSDLSKYMSPTQTAIIYSALELRPTINCYFDQIMTYEDRTTSGIIKSSLNGKGKGAINNGNCFEFVDKLSFLEKLPKINIEGSPDTLKYFPAKNFINYPFVTSTFFENSIFTNILPIVTKDSIPLIYSKDSINLADRTSSFNSDVGLSLYENEFRRKKISGKEEVIDIFKTEDENGLFQLKIDQKALYKFIIQDMINIELFNIIEN